MILMGFRVFLELINALWGDLLVSIIIRKDGIAFAFSTCLPQIPELQALILGITDKVSVIFFRTYTCQAAHMPIEDTYRLVVIDNSSVPKLACTII